MRIKWQQSMAASVSSERLEQYFIANEVIDDSKKRAILLIVRLLSAVFYDYRDRMDKSIKFCMDMLQDLLINIRRGATKKRIHSKS